MESSKELQQALLQIAAILWRRIEKHITDPQKHSKWN